MSKLDNSPSLDGVRDVMYPTSSTTANITSGSTETNVKLGADKTRFRMPIHGGSVLSSGTAVPSRYPWSFDSTTSSYNRNNFFPHRANDAVQMADLRYSFRMLGDQKSYTSTSTKSSTTRTFNGWCTLGAMQAISQSTSTSRTAQGRGVSNGDNSYTTSAMPFDTINSNHDGNKWISGLISKQEGDIFSGIEYDTYVVFEGSGASTSDNDWNTIVARVFDDSTGVFNMSNGTSPMQPTQRWHSGGSAMATTDFDLHRSDATVYTYGGRVVYNWSTFFFTSIGQQGSNPISSTGTGMIVKFF